MLTSTNFIVKCDLIISLFFNLQIKLIQEQEMASVSQIPFLRACTIIDIIFNLHLFCVKCKTVVQRNIFYTNDFSFIHLQKVRYILNV